MGITIKVQLKILKVSVMGGDASCGEGPGSSTPDTAGQAYASGTRLTTTTGAAVFGCFCPWTSFDIFLLLYLCLYSIFDFFFLFCWLAQLEPTPGDHCLETVAKNRDDMPQKTMNPA